MDATQKSAAAENKQAIFDVRGALRLGLAVLLVLLVLAYSIGIFGGWIKQSERIDAVHFALIVLTGVVALALVRPRTLARLKRFKLSGFELEMLEKVVEKQAVQASQLEDIRLILPLLLPEAERQHLANLQAGATQGYKGNHDLREELIRLRSMHLIRNLKNRHVAELKDGGVWDIGEIVELTPTGEHWIKRFREIEGNATPPTAMIP